MKSTRTAACEVCHNGEGNQVHCAREMMYGLRERFRYLECSQCGCLQLLDVPADLSRYYPVDYYSFNTAPPASDGVLNAAAKRLRAMALLKAPAGIVEFLVHRRCIPAPFMWFAGLGLSTASTVCDLGSGSGRDLVWMFRQGFSDLTGIDPYVAKDRSVCAPITIRKLELAEMSGGWDLVMLNHSFEHMAQPALVLERLRDLIKPTGSIMIRTPIADSWAWRHYGVNWVQLDAPRHLFIHTTASITLLAKLVGLSVARVFFDSYALQFWGSEQYRHDVPLRDTYSGAEGCAATSFTPAEIVELERRAEKLNREGLGDSAGFLLRLP